MCSRLVFRKKFRHRALMRGLAVWLAIAFSAGTGSADHVRICLHTVSTNTLPPPEFIERITGAIRHGGETHYSILAANADPARLAKIILHSYGIPEQRIQLNIGVPDCSNSTNFPAGRTPRFHTAFVVLGNRPLHDSTPTVDMIQRVLTAVPNVKGRTNVALVLTGGPTEGPVSEARMMALIAQSRGVAREQILLEEESWTTGRNAALTAPIIERLGIKTIFIVSKKSHLAFAMKEFRKYDVYREAIPLESPEVRADSIRQMADYLKLHKNPGVETRMEALKADSHGVD